MDLIISLLLISYIPVYILCIIYTCRIQLTGYVKLRRKTFVIPITYMLRLNCLMIGRRVNDVCPLVPQPSRPPKALLAVCIC